jgi:hypothetical protein
MHTDYKNINKLLDKYFEGLSTLENEKYLKQYFSSDMVAPEHKVYQAMFQKFNNQSHVTNPSPVRLKIKNRKIKYYYAASIALLIGLGLVWLMQSDIQKHLNFNDLATANTKIVDKQKQQEAEKEIKKFANHINKGIEKTGTLSLFGKTTKKVFNIKK